MPVSVSRRNIAKGVAWVTPVVLTATAVPAYAASTTVCQPSASIRANTYFNYGENFYDSWAGRYVSRRTAGSWHLQGASIDITDLDIDEKVTSIELVLAVETRALNADPYSAPNFYDPTVHGTNTTFAEAGEGWSFKGAQAAHSRTITVNGRTHTANMWTATFSSTGEGDYQGSSVGDCHEFQSADLAGNGDGFTYNYGSIMSLALSPQEAAQQVPNQHFTFIARTSKQRTITVKGYILDSGASSDIEVNVA